MTVFILQLANNMWNSLFLLLCLALFQLLPVIYSGTSFKIGNILEHGNGVSN